MLPHILTLKKNAISKSVQKSIVKVRKKWLSTNTPISNSDYKLQQFKTDNLIDPFWDNNTKSLSKC